MIPEFVFAFWAFVAFGMVLSVIKFVSDLAFKADEPADPDSLEGTYR